MLNRAWAETDLGRFLVVGSDRGVCFVHMDPARAEADLATWIARHVPGAEVREDDGGLAAIVDQLVRYGRGELREFDVPLDLVGTEFQRACWDLLLTIPYGATRTYSEQARRLGKPGAFRAVGSANGANPVPIIVPCHRVVAKDGLGGFGGGLALKQRMLELEGALLPTSR